MNKKRYAGLLWTQPDKYDKMDTKVKQKVMFNQLQFIASMSICIAL
jgi:hypothetical protein